MAKFYSFRQNNTGGSFKVNRMVDVLVVIEAENYEQANERAEDIGIYFDGCRKGIDCSCCGDRWYEQWDESDARDRPEYYGTPIEEAKNWVVHYLDGSKRKG